MTRKQIDTVLSDSFLSNKEIIVQLNLLDEFGWLRDDLSGFFKGEAYQDYFVLNDLPVYWEDVRHVAFKEAIKWFEANPFKEAKAPDVPSQVEGVPTLEKDDFCQPFYEEEGVNDGRNDLDKDV